MTLSRLAVWTTLLLGAGGAAGCGGGAGAAGGASTADAKVLVCAPGTVERAGACVPEEVRCAEGTTPRDGQCVQDRPEETPPPKTALVAGGETGTGYDAIVDPRKSWQSPRPRALLITELQGLESLYTSLPNDAADRPFLIRRLAEGYAELESWALRDAQTSAAGTSAKIAAGARASSLKHYVTLANQYPKFCSSVSRSTGASTGCIDEVRYYSGLAYLRGGEPDKARMAFFKLVSDFPKSSFVPLAYFQFGEMFRREAATDPAKYMLAQQSYEEALKYPHPVKNLALGRLAQVFDAQGEAAKARGARSKMTDPDVAFPPDAP